MVFNHIQFGIDILARRTELQMTGDEVSSLVTCEKSTVYAYERGVEPSPRMRHFISLCNLYDLDPRDYFELER